MNAREGPGERCPDTQVFDALSRVWVEAAGPQSFPRVPPALGSLTTRRPRLPARHHEVRTAPSLVSSFATAAKAFASSGISLNIGMPNSPAFTR